MKKSIIKKALKNLGIALLPIALTLGITSSFHSNVVDNSDLNDNKLDVPEVYEDIIINSEQKSETENIFEETETVQAYASMEQIYSLMNDIVADNSYFRTYQNFADITKPDVFNVLEHNDAEPIYIVVPDEFNERSKSLIQSSLDKVFGIISQVNDNYTYKIVDSAPINKCFIEYKVKDLQVNGLSSFDFEYSTIRNKSGTIILDDSLTNKAEKEDNFLYTATHELLHILGFQDIYNTVGSKFEGQDYAKSFMKSSYYLDTSEDFIPITPNDCKLLLSAYAKPTNNQQEYADSLELIRKVVANYEKEYYSHSVNVLKSKLKDYDAAEFDDEFVVGFKDFLNCGHNIAVKVDGEKYSLFIVDGNGTKTKIHEGAVYNIDGGAILQDIKVENAYLKNTGGVEFSGDIFLCCGVKGDDIKIIATDYSKSLSINLQPKAISGFDHLIESGLEY